MCVVLLPATSPAFTKHVMVPVQMLSCAVGSEEKKTMWHQLGDLELSAINGGLFKILKCVKFFSFLFVCVGVTTIS